MGPPRRSSQGQPGRLGRKNNRRRAAFRRGSARVATEVWLSGAASAGGAALASEEEPQPSARDELEAKPAVPQAQLCAKLGLCEDAACALAHDESELLFLAPGDLLTLAKQRTFLSSRRASPVTAVESSWPQATDEHVPQVDLLRGQLRSCNDRPAHDSTLPLKVAVVGLTSFTRTWG